MADTSSSGVESKPGDSYSIPQETQKIFAEGILGNPLIRKDLPKNFEAYAAKIRFEGSDLPSVPINWRFAESISALKGLEAVFLNALLAEKYDLDPQDILIDTDHAQLFFMSALLWQIHVDDGPPLTTASFGDKVAKQKYDALIKDCDFHGMQSGMYRSQATNIYKTRDGRFFHLHGSLNPEPTLDSIGLPHQMDAGSVEEARAPFVDALSKINSDEMQKLASETFKQAGTICWTTEEYAESEHGKANAHIGLYEIHARPNAAQGPCWWPPIQQTSAQRPLAGLRVVDLSRIIAAPAITRGLAEMGASVMRVTAPHVPDASMLHVDLNWGKWNSCLDLRRPEDRVALKALIMKADVVVSGYRPGVLDKYGFGVEDILDMCKHRENGIIVARENCYGWQGWEPPSSYWGTTWLT
ncbi:MAG: hypothetical protein M1818_003017 [Claussenomyces sp. TS43310]|nr:MAG: hypothetical protein M1818_003017 [Claussenomyces sp. TS43310]